MNWKSSKFCACVKPYLFWICVILAVTGAERVAAAEKLSRPNFLIFMADDQYKSSVGCYGANPSHTPNIDDFATQGTRFTRCFTESACCTPNRAAFLSGQYPLRNGAHANHSGFFNGVKSLPNYMQDQGYRSCLVNKDGIRKPSDLYHWESWIKESDQLAPGATDPKSNRMRQSRFDEIEAFLTKDDDRPFCLLHAARQPHAPWLGKLPNGLEGYDASNWFMDSEFGEDLALLKKHGLYESTIVIYLNDNETHVPRSKYTLYDTGLNVPCIVHWPGVTRPGSTCDAMVGLIDFLPTFVELAGGEPDPAWDGRSMVNLWRGNTQSHRSEVYLSYTGVTLGSTYSRIPFPIRGWRTERFKYLRNLNYTIPHPMLDNVVLPPEELYDLAADPGEQINLISRPEFQSVRLELSDKVDEMMADTNDRGIESEMESLARYPDGEKKSERGSNE
ncbi:MAG: sulfatase [Planctomycetaceae bacterium]|nr:sulfatase [Planctomycetaceae bacterium]